MEKQLSTTNNMDDLLAHARRAISLDSVIAQSGSLIVRLARDCDEISAAQKLRYQVFHHGDNAPPAKEKNRDCDMFDALCDHMLVVDESRKKDPVVGTYRLLLSQPTTEAEGFYSASEYDIAKMLALAEKQGMRIMELGRSCVHPQYRSKMTLHLLWRGIAAYILKNDIDLMFGCASFPGIDPDAYKMSLSLLARRFAITQPWQIRAHPLRYIEMDQLGQEEQLDEKAAFDALPPLVKGYLRLGAKIGKGAVADYALNVMDVFILGMTENIPKRYYQHYYAQYSQG